MDVWSRDLAMACGQAAPPDWMLAMLADLLGRDDLPTGVIVGSAVIAGVTPPPTPLPPGRSDVDPTPQGQAERGRPRTAPGPHPEGLRPAALAPAPAGRERGVYGLADSLPLPHLYRWHLTGVERIAAPIKPARQPQPTWFAPF